MSTMRISEETFDNIYETLTHFHEWNTVIKCNFAYAPGVHQIASPYYWGDNFPKLKGKDKFKKLVRMWDIKNHRAYIKRYAHRDDIDFEYDNYKPKHGKRLNPIELYKALQAIQYNLDDYQDKTINDYLDYLAKWIVDVLPAYQDAQWG